MSPAFQGTPTMRLEYVALLLLIFRSRPFASTSAERLSRVVPLGRAGIRISMSRRAEVCAAIGVVEKQTNPNPVVTFETMHSQPAGAVIAALSGGASPDRYAMGYGAASGPALWIVTVKRSTLP